MVRTPSVDKNGIRRGAWSEEEDNILKAYVFKHGHTNWRQMPRLAGLARCGKSCRLRWKNYLKPGLKRGNYTEEEVKQIIKLREEFGNKWSLIASKLSGRTDNEIKNYWHTHLKNPTKQGPESIISTHENVKNIDEIHVIDSVDQINSSSMCMSHESIQLKEFDSNSKALDSFPEVSSMNSNSFDLQAYEFFRHQAFLFNTPKDLITPNFDPIIWTEPFMLDSSNNQISASTINSLGLSESFTLDTLNNQILPNYATSGVDWGSWTQPMLMDSSPNDSIFSSATSNMEECMAPFMPLATGDSDLINLLSAVYSLNSDEYQKNVPGQ